MHFLPCQSAIILRWKTRILGLPPLFSTLCRLAAMPSSPLHLAPYYRPAIHFHCDELSILNRLKGSKRVSASESSLANFIQEERFISNWICVLLLFLNIFIQGPHLIDFPVGPWIHNWTARATVSNVFSGKSNVLQEKQIALWDCMCRLPHTITGISWFFPVVFHYRLTVSRLIWYLDGVFNVHVIIQAL